jgi:hypothetical protein
MTLMDLRASSCIPNASDMFSASRKLVMKIMGANSSRIQFLDRFGEISAQ